MVRKKYTLDFFAGLRPHRPARRMQILWVMLSRLGMLIISLKKCKTPTLSVVLNVFSWAFFFKVFGCA